MKFSVPDENGNSLPFDYGNRYFRQPCGDAERLVIGATNQNVKLLDQLSTCFSSQTFYLLYVLLLSHDGRSPGRYQSPTIESHEDLQVFIWSFQEFLEGDGRHHLWIASPNSTDLIVYDQHDVIFAYGDLDAFESLLLANGFASEEFWFPFPHTHSFDPKNVRYEEELLAYFDWTFFELQDGDEWE